MRGKRLFLFSLFIVFVSCAKRYSGSISKNTVWKGKIKLTGDVFVERRAVLKILPGTKISYARRSRNQIRYIREEAAGPFNILQNEKIEILVEGTFIAIGEKEKPIKFQRSQNNGGLVFLGKNPVELSFVEIDGSPVAIRVYGESSPQIINCRIENCEVAGIGYWDMGGGKIKDSTFLNCRHAIGVADFANPEILNTTISFSKMAGIFCEGNSSPRIHLSKITGNNIGIAGGDISNPEISSNTISGNGAGIALWVKSDAKISHNKISKNISGILVQGESRARILKNSFLMNGSGISCVESGDADIQKNSFTDNNFAVILRDSSRAVVKNNRILGGDGIKLSEISRATIAGNTFSNCDIAVKLMNRSRTVFRNNKMKNVGKIMLDERVK